ncbi:MAG: MFS transporter, partial [Rhodospirillales bacterium]|nr:MFS transporter [Rhodospirillales bacterium]
AVFGVLHFVGMKGDPNGFTGFFAMFLVLFAATGVGNASTFQMIPIIFLTQHQHLAAGKGAATQAEVGKLAAKEAAAVLGFSSAVAAYGAFFIPKSYGTSIALTGGPEAALWGFLGFYVTCVFATWWCYRRKGAEIRC